MNKLKSNLCIWFSFRTHRHVQQVLIVVDATVSHPLVVLDLADHVESIVLLPTLDLEDGLRALLEKMDELSLLA